MRNRHRVKVDLPDPVLPHTPNFSQGFSSNETPLSTLGNPDLYLHTKSDA